MDEYWGATKEEVTENVGEPHETSHDEKSGLDQFIYIHTADKDFNPDRHISYGFIDDRLTIISTGYEFREGLFKQYELYYESLIKKWGEELNIEPTRPSSEDEDGHLVTVWNIGNSEIVVFFSNDASNPQLVVIQTYKPNGEN